MSTFDFLVELGTEELPPKALSKLSNAFTQGVVQELASLKLAHGEVTAYAAPRRLAIHINALQAQQANEVIEKHGPAKQAAYDKEGNPSKAALGFARSNGCEFEDLDVVETAKGPRLAFKATKTGQKTTELLEAIIAKSLAQLPIPKRMRWGVSRTEFVRPAHWLIMLADDQVIPATVLGIKASNQTRGHRFHSEGEITIDHANNYQQTLLNEGKVVASFDDRKAMIKEQAANVGVEVAKGNTVIGEALLDEVTGLVEWPVALCGSFDESFLDVPAEALVSSMREHQKYFHVVDSDGQLLPRFVFISNIESTRPQSVIEGNEKVIRPRLADAAFFFKTDLKTTLEAQRSRLHSIVFQKQLGTIFEKTERISKLAAFIADKTNGDSQLAARAGQLCKSDLVSEMVLEFDDLQGIAGSYYALHDGEHKDVAAAMQEQYLPKFSGDIIPSAHTGTAVALADRLDTLAGIFAIGQLPTGSKDPFALRRASIGALRILVEHKLDLDLNTLVSEAVKQLPVECEQDTVTAQVVSYMLERFRAQYVEDGVRTEVVNAVLSKKVTNPLDFSQRVMAVSSFEKLDESDALAAANKRVANLLSKHSETLPSVDTTLFAEEAESMLNDAIDQASVVVKPLIEQRDYEGALINLAKLRAPLDNFFDGVMVMADDLAIRANRLAILSKAQDLFLDIADISVLASK